MRNARGLVVGILSAGLAAGAAACGGGGGGGVECGAGTVEMDGTCVTDDQVSCAEGTTEVDGECVPDGTVICETGTTYNEETGKCEVDESGCAAGTVLVDGQCVPEDDTLTGDVTEPPEPNGLHETHTPGSFTAPAQGESLVIEGCVSPYEDLNPLDTQLDSDLDAYVFEVGGPTLLDVTVDGVGGLAGGFAILPAGSALSADGWIRFGASLVSDTSQRQVFLPSAGTYVLVLTDSRSLFGSGAVGSDDTCYFATVANVALPSPTAITGSATDAVGADTLFYSYDPGGDDAILTEEIFGSTSATELGLTVLVDGAYKGSIEETREEDPDFQRPERLLTADADDDSEVLFAVEPVVDLSLSEVEATLTVVDERLPDAAAPADGTVTLTHSEAQPDQLLSFDATAGEVVRVESSVPEDTDAFLYGPSLRSLGFFSGDWIALLCLGTPGGPFCGGDEWVRVQETGTYYVQVENTVAADGETYDVTLTRTQVVPADLTLGTTANVDLSAGGDRDFFLLDVSSDPWLDFLASGFAGTISAAHIRTYPAVAEGQLDFLVEALPFGTGNSAGTAFGKIVAGYPDELLVSVEDAEAHDGDEAFDFDVTSADFTDLGTVDSASDVTANGETIAAGETNFYLVRTTQGERVTLSVAGTGGTDPALHLLQPDEARAISIDDTGADQTETFTFFGQSSGFAAFEVETASGDAGTVDVSLSGEAPVTGAVDPFPDLDIPDGDPDGVSASFMIPDTCTIDLPFAGVEVRHTNIADLVVTLTSPNGTELTLHDQSGTGTDLVGLYADGPVGDFTPVDALSTLVGESASGTWTLTVTDQTADDDVGKLKSFSVATFCQ